MSKIIEDLEKWLAWPNDDFPLQEVRDLIEYVKAAEPILTGGIDDYWSQLSPVEMERMEAARAKLGLE